MNKALEGKVRETVLWLRGAWRKCSDFHRFAAFSTGKDSLALMAMLYEAVGEDCPPCLYVHHDLEFPSNLEYAHAIRDRGFNIQVLRPHLEYFELMKRGMGFITLKEPWCIPLLIGTGLADWLKDDGAAGAEEGAMFRGMSGSEYSHFLHQRLELYKHLNMPCFNPMLQFSRAEIIEVSGKRYGLSLNPIYEHMNRSYCICCYTSDAKRQFYSARHFPTVCRKYYGQIDDLLFRSGLVGKAHLDERFKTREEKLDRHGFVHWKRHSDQTTVAAVRRTLSSGALLYSIKDASLISSKHLAPLKGKWTCDGSEIRFWDVSQKVADTVIRRMLNTTTLPDSTLFDRITR
jgi:3'-phosphoadenosine 5'-phosphosulfate sulfotransferase (PAPS reductase)/FAD synthetase